MPLVQLQIFIGSPCGSFECLLLIIGNKAFSAFQPALLFKKLSNPTKEITNF